MNNKFRFIALAIVILMVVSMISGFIIGGIGANAQSVESMQKELDELAKKKEELERQLNVISEKKEKELEKKSIIDEQINATRDEINVLNTKETGSSSDGDGGSTGTGGLSDVELNAFDNALINAGISQEIKFMLSI